ncbi:MAG: asparagine synthase (glutamine-hydrolyzing) [Gemmatimonadota bacterium]|nr:MAG: asparagine synthase (glutamine-hydrolyzing) [Gemmatimonadota bacterium]
MVAPRGTALAQSSAVSRMAALLRHRGPDAHGLATIQGAAFGAERLRVIDTTPAADQPFTALDGNVLLVMNGAIYNAPELRRRYAAFPFRSRSDVEPVLPLYLERGHEGLADLDGMFAIAIYDARTHELVLARDRAGEKPLFYTSVGEEVWFASEVQALLTGAPQRGSLNKAAMLDFLTLGYISEPETMFRHIRRVQAGTALVIDETGRRIFRYWDCDAVARETVPTSGAMERLERLLRRAVDKQLTADVPVGVFSSGGIDSALLTALAVRSVGANRIQTFGVGFSQRPFDESRHARRLADLLQVRHVTLEVDESSLAESLHTVVAQVAEPMADPATLPTYLLARAARDYVKVVLSGEGADELFGGYPTYLGHRAARLYQRLPISMRSTLRKAANALPVSLEAKVPLEYLLRRFVACAEEDLSERHIHWFGTGLTTDMFQGELDAQYRQPPFPEFGDDMNRAMLFDFRTYLRDNLLAKVDRATMLNSLESRAPYLDQAVVRFALAIPSSLKIRRTTTKWLLKQVAGRWLPRSIVHRKKRGLSVPIAQWLNGGLAREVDRLLHTDRIEGRGLLHGRKVQQLVLEHRCGRANHSRAIWALLMLEYWIERWITED